MISALGFAQKKLPSDLGDMIIQTLGLWAIMGPRGPAMRKHQPFSHFRKPFKVGQI